MPEPTRARPDPELPPPPREWLVTNGLGGYASGTVAGVLTRRYHGLLIAAHPSPLGRYLALVALDAVVEPGNGEAAGLGRPGAGSGGSRPSRQPARLHAFRLDHGLPVWTWEVGDRRIRRRLVMPHGHNTVSVEYALLEGPPLELVLHPLFQPRNHDESVDTRHCEPEAEPQDGGLVIRCGDLPPVRLRFPADVLHVEDSRTIEEVPYDSEAERGYPSIGTLWSPGTLGARLESGRPLTLVASTEPPPTPVPDHPALHAAEVERRQRLTDRAGADSDLLRRLTLAADSFLFDPVARSGRGAARSVIAGYHWFTDWGRDTMIALEGLALATGRADEAGRILRTFASHTRDGLIPNLFPEGGEEGLYHTADATLWFFHAVHRYVEHTGDADLLQELLPTLRDIVRHHVEGTRFGIGVDPGDDLLRQGEEGYQLTWMDAKVDDWVVTPRRGKAVEINALWYNALRLLAGWLRSESPEEADALERRAERTRRSFNDRFWHPDGGYLYDVIDPDDPAFRPNQLFAIALDHPVLDEARWEAVLDQVADRLLTPVGLRSLAPGHPDYAPTYTGDLRSRDAAYHQGTVWGWLIGPFVDAWLRVHPDRKQEARDHLQGLVTHLDEAGIGFMSEIFDAEPPFTPRGCIAQAWTVAEVLRALGRTREEGEG